MFDPHPCSNVAILRVVLVVPVGFQRFQKEEVGRLWGVQEPLWKSPGIPETFQEPFAPTCLSVVSLIKAIILLPFSNGNSSYVLLKKGII